MDEKTGPTPKRLYCSWCSTPGGTQVYHDRDADCPLNQPDHPLRTRSQENPAAQPE